jgi:putative ABC transport system permease protein
MWQLVMRNLWQRRLRSLLTVLGIAVAVQVNLTVTGVISGYEADLQNQLSALAGRIFVQRPTTEGSEMEEFPSAGSSISNDLAQELLNLDGIDWEASSAILYLPLASPPISGLPPALSAVGTEAGHETAFLSDLEISAGQGKLQGPRSVILGQGAAEQLSPKDDVPAQPGDTIELLNQRFSVAGVLAAAPGLFDGMVLMDLDSAQALFERPESVSAVILTMESVADVDSIRAKIEAMDSRLQTGSQEEVMDAAMEMMSVTEGFTGMINSAVYVVVFLFVTIVMIVGVMERQHGRRDSDQMAEHQPAGDFHRSGASLLPAWKAVQVDPLEALRYE